MDTIGNFGIAQVEDDMEQKIFTLDADRSNSMKSANPNSGIHESNVAKTLDTTTPTPQKAQGGQMIVAYNARGNGDGKTANTITGDHADRVMDYTPIVASFMGGQGSKAGGIAYKEDVSATIKAAPSGGNQVPDIVVPINSMVIGKDIKEGDRQTTGIGKEGDPCPTLQTEHHHAVASHLSVRRLLPIECERLMGFPDNWTKIPWRGKPAEECPDAPRYKACGNSMGVNCMRWIGLGIEAVEAKHRK